MMLVYRLPGPITIRSASSMARLASSPAATFSGVSQTRSIADELRDLRLSGDLDPAEQSSVQRDRRTGRRHDLAAHRQDPIHLADALLEVVALDRRHRRQQQVADRVAAQAGLTVAREAVLQQLGHQRLRVGQGGDAVADVAHRRDAELLAQPAGRPAIVGNRDHGRDVARVLFDPAQQAWTARSRRR